MILVSLFDSKAQTWSNPHVCQNKAAALREFGMLVNDSRGSLVSQNPADFDLFQVACCNDLFDGELRPCSPAFHLANGKDVKQLPPEVKS